MEDHYRLNESETRTEFVDAESGIVSIVIEERAAEAKCVVNVNDHESTTSYDFNCAISCESIKNLKRCRKQLVNSFASYQVSGFSCGWIAEDRFDLFNYMVVGTGIYSHFTIDTMSQSQLSNLGNRISAFKHRHFSDTATVNGRILIHGGSKTDLADVEELAVMFQQTQGLNEMLFQLFLDYDQQNVHDIDIWLFPAEKVNSVPVLAGCKSYS